MLMLSVARARNFDGLDERSHAFELPHHRIEAAIAGDRRESDDAAAALRLRDYSSMTVLANAADRRPVIARQSVIRRSSHQRAVVCDADRISGSVTQRSRGRHRIAIERKYAAQA
jgi:hypothetical protein